MKEKLLFPVVNKLMCNKGHNILKGIFICFFNCIEKINTLVAAKAIQKIHKMIKKRQQINLAFIFFLISLPDVIAFLVCSVTSGQCTIFSFKFLSMISCI